MKPYLYLDLADNLWARLGSVRAAMKLALLSACVIYLLAVPASHAAEQEIAYPLREGWNAIALNLELSNPSLEAVAASHPAIEEVVLYVPQYGQYDFVTSLVETGWNEDKWLRWYAEGPLTVLNQFDNLPPTYPLFIRCSAATTLNLKGRPVPLPRLPQAGKVDFASLPVSDRNPVTFNEYFEAASSENVPLAIYRLRDNAWESVNFDTRVQRNEVYAFHFERMAANYYGPIHFLDLPTQTAWRLNRRSLAAVLDYRSASDDSIALVMEEVSGHLDLSLRHGIVSSPSLALAGPLILDSIAPAELGRVEIQASDSGSSILRISDNREISCFYVEVIAP